ncbi:hypothetical protein K7G98_14705, partial [Saccharothrix sp. MB29]|nr:hypothetical protein [Saccharothrix sp. MB29]
MGPPQAGGRVLSLVLLDPDDTLVDLAGAFAVWAAGWRIGVVTNGEPDDQGAKLRRTGLAEHLDGWCASGEAGVRKPDPAISHLAARRCGGGDGRGVGDSPVLD